MQKQSEEALKALDFEEFKKSINFADVFSDLDTQTTTSLRVLREKSVRDALRQLQLIPAGH